MTFNKVMLMGRLTDNPEAPRTLPNSGSTVLKFRMAVGLSKKNPQTGQWENDPNPLYITCEVFHRPENKRDLCNLVTQYVKKGDPIFIEGRLQLDQWQDKTTGQQRSMHKIVVENIQLLGGGNKPAGGGSSSSDYSGGMDDDGPPQQSSRPPAGRGFTPPPAQPVNDGPEEGGEIPF